MGFRSSNRVQFWTRMLFLVLLSLAVYSAVSAYLGWKDVFAFWQPERMRWFLAMGVVWCVAAHEMRVTGRTAHKQTPPDEGLAPQQPEEKAEGNPDEEAKTSPGGKADEPREFPAKDVAASKPHHADDLWRQARGMMHGFVPDPVEDFHYLALVHAAATAGHVKAQVKLAEYASRRNALVEAYYWMAKARRNGQEGADEFLCQCRKHWKAKGCRPEYENEYEFFTERQGVLARAALRRTCGVDVERATRRLDEMIADGDAEAGEFKEESENAFRERAKTV